MDNKLLENIDPKKQKYINLFKYLKEFALLRDEVVRNIEQSSKYQFHVWLNDIPENKSFECIIWDSIQDKETANWIQIKKPKEPEFPMPSEELRQWIVIASDITDTINIPSLNENIVIEDKIFELKDFPNIQKEFNSYLEKWLEWSEIYKEYLNLMTIYNKFFNIYKQSKKFGDEYELVMGIGLLCFKVEGEAKSVIKRHCFVADAAIDFNAEKGIFTINEGKEGAKLRLETEMLKDLLEYDMNIQKDVEEKLKEYSEVPFSNDLKNTLKMWVQSLHFNGNFIDRLDNKISLSSKPTILYAPAIILRKRNTKSLANSFSNIIDYILSNMPDKINLIDDLIGNVDFESDYNETNNNSSHKTAHDEEIYFPKPANEQQIEIVERLKRHNKVLVQGPPGTGKSHTIANLICHLLATNKRVLITAQTKRALSVIKEKLPEEIQPLCINLLGNDQDSIEDLESSVKEINNRLSYFDKKKTIQDINVFETKLKEKKTLLSETKNKIIAIREKDTKNIALALLTNILMIVSCYKNTYGDKPITENTLLIDFSAIFIFTYNLFTWLFELYDKKWLFTAIALNSIVIAGLFLEMLLTPSDVLRTSSTSIFFSFLLLSLIPYYNISMFRGVITTGDASDKKSYYISIAALILIIILIAYTLFNIENITRAFTLYSYLIIISLSWIFNKLISWQHKTKI